MVSLGPATRSRTAIALFVLAAAAGLARAVLNNGQGLRAEYAAAPQWGGASHVGIAEDVSTRTLIDAWDGSLPPQFRATWSGYLVVARAGLYTLATTSDDGSTLTIDGQRIVDNSGDHSVQTRTGRIRLSRGSHPIRIEYSQAAGEYEMGMSWATGDAALAPVPASALWTRHVNAWRPWALELVDWVFLASLVGLGAAIVWGAWQFKGREWADAAGHSVRETAGAIARKPPLPRPATMFRVVMLAVSLVVAVLLAEFAARVFFRSVRSSGDARNYFAQQSEPARVNALGYRGAEVAEKNGRYRIAVIGDSITWGVGLPETERYSNVLQSTLGSQYEVLNFGIPGHNMPEHLQVLDEVLGLSPDFVLLQLYTNDFEIGPMERPRTRPLLPWPSTDRWLRQSSVIYTMLSAQWPRVQEQIGMAESYEHYMYRYLGDPQSPESRAGFGMLHEFIARSRDAGVPVGTVMFPNPELMAGHYPFAYLHDRVHGVCVDEHVHCVDLRQPFLAKFKDINDIVVSPFDGHPSTRASQVAAQAVLAEFAPIWRVPVPSAPGHQ